MVSIGTDRHVDIQVEFRTRVSGDVNGLCADGAGIPDRGNHEWCAAAGGQPADQVQGRETCFLEVTDRLLFVVLCAFL